MEPPDVLYRALLDQLPQGALIVEDCRPSFANPAFARMLGYSVPELLGKEIGEIFAPEDTLLIPGLEQSLSPGPAGQAVRLLHRNGRTRIHVILDARPVLWSGKGSFIGIVRETAEPKDPKDGLREANPGEYDRRRAEEARRRAEKQLLNAFMTMPALMALIRLHDSIFLNVNKMFCDVIGLDRREIIGRSVMELRVMDCRQITPLDVSFQAGKPVANEIVPFRTHNGDSRYGLLSSHNIDIGAEACALTIIQDITELRDAQQALMEREETLEKKTKQIEEINTALKTLLDMRYEEKLGYEKEVQAAICDTLLPHVDKLKNTGMDRRGRECLGRLENALLAICSTHLHSTKAIHSFLTPREAEVASLIQLGKKTKEIADALNLSPGTVDTHRHSIRKKLRLPGKKERLMSHLRMLD